MIKDMITCSCGGPCIKLEKNELFVFSEKRLLIKDVPYYKCTRCRKEFKTPMIKRQVKFIEQNFVQQVFTSILSQQTECKFYYPILS